MGSTAGPKIARRAAEAGERASELAERRARLEAGESSREADVE